VWSDDEGKSTLVSFITPQLVSNTDLLRSLNGAPGLRSTVLALVFPVQGLVTMPNR